MTDLSTHVFALDLTSVCVSTGIVQLPMKMQPYFEDGEIDATVDGEGVRLEFAGPRRLGGFRAHFEKRGLNANDRIRFELNCDDGRAVEVLAACVKRERSKPTSQPQSVAEGDGEGIVAAPATADSESPTPTSGHVGSSWSGTGGTVRAVRRITIVGSDLLPAAGSTQMNRAVTGYVPKRSASTQQGSARPTSWQALDGLSRDDNSEHAGDVEFADTTVRAVRRRVNPDVPARNFGDASAPALEAANRLVAQDGPQSDGVVQFDVAVDNSTPVRLSDLVAPSEKQRRVDQSSRPVSARTRIFAARGPRAEQSTFNNAGKPVSASGEPAASGSTAPEQLTEQELVPVARESTPMSRSAVAAPPATSEVAAAGGSFVRSAATVSSSFTHAAADKPSRIAEPISNSNHFRSPPAAESSQRATSAATSRPSGASPAVIDDADFGGDYAAPRREVAQEVNHEQKVTLSDQEPMQVPAGANNEAARQTDLEQDLSLVIEFLDRPEVPAIVRSDLVADRLGMSTDRCERALERLSEDRDRVSRIRKGAYMIRRDATKRVTG